MSDTLTSRIAVAMLTEASENARTFRLSPNQPLQGYCLISGEPEDPHVTIYVEHRPGGDHSPVLQGRLAWLHGEQATGGEEQAPHESDEALSEPAPEPSPVLAMQAAASPERGRESAPAALEEPQAPQAPPAPVEQSPASPAPAGEQEQEPAEHPFRLVPEPAVPVNGSAPDPRKIALETVHPLATRGAGAALVNMAEGSLTLNLRALPNPIALGREPTTNRPYNTYRVWLVSRRGGSPFPVGLCTRVWGENYRFESEPGLPLARYDEILITAEDRSVAAPNPQAPKVLAGHYRSHEA